MCSATAPLSGGGSVGGGSVAAASHATSSMDEPCRAQAMHMYCITWHCSAMLFCWLQARSELLTS